MKKALIIVVLAGMFAWAVYDLTADSQDAQQANESEFTVEEDAFEESEGTDEPAGELDDHDGSDKVGLEPGNIAPDFQLETMDGESIKLSDLRGQRVMVNFWATWCPPCRAEVPDLQKFYENKDIEILAINLTGTEKNRSDVDEFASEFGMTFPILMDENTAVANQYQIQPIPSSFMIDSEGRIQFKALGAMNYELMVQEFEKMS
ncbi:peroxiredoxin family protein [Lentibacillus salicampi]|uniref:TlpA family protein disulfide reductase n=1 Tax=Lentibacillus salicampi TaxID=175306 RepID=A0A4Y9A7Y3_9BACI|nr:TlpA disulfide reductase family protein [Lentibacillus salicampi]TFJ91908.1 TlpA family protein disulfide reductase [Lentibacillus salicampi]